MPQFVAGHSLGEFTALVACEALSLEEAVRLVDKRSQLMESCPKGAMSAVLGMDKDVLQQCCDEATKESKSANTEATVIIANYNTREQLVVSGSPDAVAKAGELAKAKGGKVIPLPVGGAFHSPLMSSAASVFEQEIKQCRISHAKFAIVQNVDAKASLDQVEIQEKLSKQMPSAVRWCDTVEFMLAQGVDTFVEIGPGKVLAGTVKKIDKQARIFNIYDGATLESTLTVLRQTVIA